MNKYTRLGALLLAAMMAFQDLCVAQSGAPRPSLKIVVVEGEGAINNIQRGSGRDPVVEVRDENDAPVPGARLTFSLPERGPGGTFFGAGNSLSVITNQQGRGVGTGFRPNLTTGRFQIHVTAVQGDRTGALNITQSNVLPDDSANRAAQSERKFGKRKILTLLAIGGIIGTVVATRGDDTSTTTVPGTSVTPGTISVGAPR
jgi:hypothetical protein